MRNQRFVFGSFFALIAIFILIMSGILFGWIRGEFFLPAIGLFCLLGIVLTVLTRRGKLKGKLRKFLLLTGGSAAGFTIFSVMHNLFYGLNIVFGHIPVLGFLLEALHVAFFFISIICPLGFLVGAAGSLFLLVKHLKK